MKTASSLCGRVLLLALFLGSHLSLTGCSDESKTSGTMVQVSDEAKKQIEDRRASYKAKAKSPKEKSNVRKTR